MRLNNSVDFPSIFVSFSCECCPISVADSSTLDLKFLKNLNLILFEGPSRDKASFYLVKMRLNSVIKEIKNNPDNIRFLMKNNFFSPFFLSSLKIRSEFFYHFGLSTCKYTCGEHLER